MEVCSPDGCFDRLGHGGPTALHRSLMRKARFNQLRMKQLSTLLSTDSKKQLTAGLHTLNSWSLLTQSLACIPHILRALTSVLLLFFNISVIHQVSRHPTDNSPIPALGSLQCAWGESDPPATLLTWWHLCPPLAGLGTQPACTARTKAPFNSSPHLHRIRKQLKLALACSMRLRILTRFFELCFIF